MAPPKLKPGRMTCYPWTFANFRAAGPNATLFLTGESNFTWYCLRYLKPQATIQVEIYRIKQHYDAASTGSTPGENSAILSRWLSRNALLAVHGPGGSVHYVKGAPLCSTLSGKPLPAARARKWPIQARAKRLKIARYGLRGKFASWAGNQVSRILAVPSQKGCIGKRSER